MRLPSISPSVYIAYHELQAFISCPTTGYIARGKYYNTTIAYAPEELSARAHQTCAFSEINYTKLANYPLWSATDLILSLPGALSSVDPVWSTCAPASYGAFDPPTIMQKATALTDPAKWSTLSTPAAPGGYVGPAHGPSTTTSAVASSNPGISQAILRSVVSRTTNSQRSDPTKTIDTTIIRGSHSHLASQSPSNTPPKASRSESKISDPDDLTNTSSASKATTLTNPTKESTLSTPITLGEYVGPAHDSSTTTFAVVSSGSRVFQAISRSAVPRTTDSQRFNPTEAIDTNIIRGSHPHPASQSPSNTPPKASRSESKISDPDDPTNTSLVPERHGLDSGDHTANEQNAVSQAPIAIATATAMGKDGPDPTLRLVGSTVASASQQISYSNAFLHVGGFDPTRGGTTRPVQQKSLTLPDGILVSPSSRSDEVSIGNQTVHILTVPAATQEVPFSSSGSSSIMSASAAPGQEGNSHSAAFATANTSMTAGANTSRPSTAPRNGSTTQTYTGGNERSIHRLWRSVAVFLSLAVTTTALGIL